MNGTIDHRPTRKIRLDRRHSIKFQLLTELCFLKGENLISTDLDILSILASMGGPVELKKFCAYAAGVMYPVVTTGDKEKFPQKIQYIRNRLVMLQDRGLVKKERKGRGPLLLSFCPTVDIHCSGNILLDYQFLTIEAAQA